MKYIKLFEAFKPHDPYELMMIPLNKKAEMIIEEIKKSYPNLNLVNDLIVLGANLEWKDEENGGLTPLHVAAEFGRVDIAQMLIAAGADVNMQDDIGETPLHRAAYYGIVEIVRMLIAAGSDVNILSVSNWSSLHWATTKGDEEIAQILIDAGADVNVKNKRDWTALHLAVWENNSSITKILIDAGADLNSQTIFGTTALHLAVDKTEIAQMLVDAGVRTDIRDKYGKLPYDLAKTEEMKNLLKP
jgi:ankyrin repeat protein